MYFNEKHKEKVKNRGDDYIYIGSYHKNEETIDRKNERGGRSFIRVKCPYCGSEYDILTYNFLNRKDKCSNCCNCYENSFAYHIQVELGESLNKYWDWEKNAVNPYMVYKQSKKLVYIKCIDIDYHDSYLTTIKSFYNGNRCPYCNPFASHKVHQLDSFGALYPEKAKYWDYKKNKKSSFKVSPKSAHKFWFKCEKCGSSFQRTLNNLNQKNIGVICRSCNASELERKAEKYLIEYNIRYDTQVEYNNLVGLGGGNLSYDFYLPDYNLLIECQGEQHESWIEGWITKDGFEKQLEHDKRKKQYAKEHNINLLEIWYYDIDHIEDILIKTLQIKNN